MKTAIVLICLLLGSPAQANSFNWPPGTGGGSGGTTGPTGSVGPTGPSGGPTGATGATGANGTNGSNGAVGATGASGANGTNGSAGAAGATGATGVASIGAFNNTSTANGLDLSGAGVLALHAADGTNPGAVSAAAQSFPAFTKTFTGGVIAASGITAGTGNLQNAEVYIKATTTADTGFLMQNANNTKTISLNGSSANVFSWELSGGNPFTSIGNGTSATAPAAWMGFTDAGAGPSLAWPWAYETASANGAVTGPTGYVKSNGANVNGYPLIVARNNSSTVNTIECFATAGSSNNLMSGTCSRNITQTASSEDADWFEFNQTAGTPTEHLRVKPKGQLVYLGSAPAAGTCGTSPVAPVGNDNVFKITSGTGGSSGSCAVTLATAPLTGGVCRCEDETSQSSFTVGTIVSSSTVTMTTYSRTTGIAANFNASDVFSCICHFY